MTPEQPPLTLVPSRHRGSLARLRRDRWLGVRDGGLQGNTQDALARLGLAETRWRKKPYEHQVARLTELGQRWLEAHDEKWRAAEQARAQLASIDAARVEKGLCRHCGGPVPCWSPYGDAKVGIKWSALNAAERTELEEATQS